MKNGVETERLIIVEILKHLLYVVNIELYKPGHMQSDDWSPILNKSII